MIARDTLLDERYRIVELLGTGAMGSVYLALDERLSSNVAVKSTIFRRFHLAPEQIAELRRAFEREAKLLANLQHDAIPRVVDYFYADDEQHLVMEFIPGADLFEQFEIKRRQNESFAVETVIDWTLQLLDALDYLHTQPEPVIHKDIKLSNLKITKRNRVKLLDFGISKGYAGEMTRVDAGSLQMGTEEYAPLEQFLKFPSRAAETLRHALSIKHQAKVEEISSHGTDARSDLYSLAVTVYRLLTQKPPADYLPRALAVWEGHADPLVPIDELNKDVPVNVSNVLMRALALEPANRPASAKEMCDQLQTAWNDHLRATQDCEDIVLVERRREREEIERRLTAQYEKHLAAEIARRETAEAALVARERELNQLSRQFQELSTTGFNSLNNFPRPNSPTAANTASAAKRDSLLAKLLGKKYLGAILLAVVAIFGAALTLSFSRGDKTAANPANALPQKTESAAERFERGKELMRGKDYDRAIAEFSAAIELDPRAADALATRGEARRRKDDYDNALADFDRAIEIDNNNLLALATRADIYCQQNKDYDRAFADFERIAKTQISDFLYEKRGACYAAQNKFDEALADYNRALKLDPNEPSTYFRRGVVYMQRNKIRQALADFNRVIELEPTNWTAYANRAEIYKIMGKDDLARADKQKSEELRSN